MRLAILFATALTIAPLGANADAPQSVAKAPLLQSIAGDVKPDELRATIAKLVGFGTRHTLSDTKSNTRGIGAARRWVKSRFEEFNRQCKGCLQIQLPEQTVTGERIPQPSLIIDVLAIQRGTSDPDRVIVISGHIDSRVRDVMFRRPKTRAQKCGGFALHLLPFPQSERTTENHQKQRDDEQG